MEKTAARRRTNKTAGLSARASSQTAHVSNPRTVPSPTAAQDAATDRLIARARDRRTVVLERLRAESPATGLLVAAAPEAIRSADTHHPYRQDSDFLALTGFDEPEAVALVLPHQKDHPYVLYVRPRDPEREAWDGARAGVDGARTRYEANFSASIAQMENTIGPYLEGLERLYYAFGKDVAMDARVSKLLAWLRQTRNRRGTGVITVVDPTDLLHEMRLRKSTDEIATMRRAAEITVQGHEAGMAVARPGAYEYEVLAEIEYTFRKLGSPSWGYPTIVGSGPNATTLHYREATRAMQDGELVLVDAGAEFEFYTADVTRTYPVNGRFSKAQRELYEIVLAAQDAGIAAARVGRAFSDVHTEATRVLIEGLIDVGLLVGTVDDNRAQQTYTRYYMHQTSHWLGMDVHDVGRYRLLAGDAVEARRLEAGMVLTVEPGLYIREGVEPPKGVSPEILEKYSGIGIRIEDDVVVTDGEPDVLTGALVKRADEVERCLRGRRAG
ncbi:MAG: aminopeptidase P N-terminal domain-containing protein [Deltaproteobacteria bacterium]|nr:aminopeptidase P N-terminal domain-containing protein [Deltaproteobacteria bacterium]